MFLGTGMNNINDIDEMLDINGENKEEKQPKKRLSAKTVIAGVLIIAFMVVLAVVLENITGAEQTSLQATERFVDEFSEFSNENFLSINSITGKPTSDVPAIINGQLVLFADDYSRAPVVLSRPVIMKDELVFERDSFINAPNGYAGYLKMLWVSGSGDEDPYLLLSIEYNDRGELSGKKGHFTLLSKAQSNIEKEYDFIENAAFEEKIVYDQIKNKITYSLNGEEHTYNAPVLKGGYVYFIMQTVSESLTGDFLINRIEVSSSEGK